MGRIIKTVPTRRLKGKNEKYIFRGRKGNKWVCFCEFKVLKVKSLFYILQAEKITQCCSLQRTKLSFEVD